MCTALKEGRETICLHTEITNTKEKHIKMLEMQQRMLFIDVTIATIDTAGIAGLAGTAGASGTNINDKHHCRQSRHVRNIRTAGKTGTAEVSSNINKKEQSYNRLSKIKDQRW